MKKIILIALSFCMAGISTSFAMERTISFDSSSESDISFTEQINDMKKDYYGDHNGDNNYYPQPSADCSEWWETTKPVCKWITVFHADSTVYTRTFSMTLKETAHWAEPDGSGGCYYYNEETGRELTKRFKLQVKPYYSHGTGENVFKVCLNSMHGYPFLTEHKTMYKYSKSWSTTGDVTTFVLTPIALSDNPPGIDGSRIEEVSYDGSLVRIEVLDAYNMFFDRTEFNFEIYKDGFFYNKLLLEKTEEKYARSKREFKYSLSDLKPGKYFIKWGFKRVGRQTSSYVDKGKYKFTIK